MEHTRTTPEIEQYITDEELQLMKDVAENKGTFNNKQIADILGIPAAKVKAVYDCYRFYLAGHQDASLSYKNELKNKTVITHDRYDHLVNNQKNPRKKFLGIF